MYVPVHFKDSEFQALTPACHYWDMDPSILILLDELRTAIQRPIILTSAYRSSQWDKERGRSGKGPHTKRMAVDISCGDSKYRAIILETALRMPFVGIGIGSNFIHLDIVPRETGRLIWVY